VNDNGNSYSAGGDYGGDYGGYDGGGDGGGGDGGGLADILDVFGDWNYFYAFDHRLLNILTKCPIYLKYF